MIWSHGQPQGGYQHSPRSGLEKGEPGVRDFYRDDELKYHGRASYRGKFLLDFRDNFLCLTLQCKSSGYKNTW